MNQFNLGEARAWSEIHEIRRKIEATKLITNSKMVTVEAPLTFSTHGGCPQKKFSFLVATSWHPEEYAKVAEGADEKELRVSMIMYLQFLNHVEQHQQSKNDDTWLL